jgi:SAM-dependent methyltransferase
MDRRQRILGEIDVATGRGVEIGPLHAPIVRKADGPVLYVDYDSTEVVKANRPAKIDPEQIVDVDIVWGERPLAEAVGAPLDYIVASHVIEHVPDLVAWFAELHAALKVGGVLTLAIPDRRFTFDVSRRESLVEEVLEAHLERRTRPSPKQIIECASRCRPVDTAEAWRTDVRGQVDLFDERLPSAFALASRLQEDADRYTDTHCWVFTPASFVTLARALHHLGLFPFEMSSLTPTATGDMEFFARLTAVPAAERSRIATSIERAAETLAGSPVPPEETAGAALEAALARAAAAEREAEELRRRVEALEASASWRATAPLRALSGALRR